MKKQPSPLEIMDEFLKIRETLAGMVVGLRGDGFSEAQARRIVTRIMTSVPESPEETASEDESEPPW